MSDMTATEIALEALRQEYGPTRYDDGKLMLGDGPPRVEAILGGMHEYWEMRVAKKAIEIALAQATPSSQPDDWQPCERTVRLCIEALPNMGTGKHPHSLAALEALLPKPDPAEALVKEYKDTRHGFPVMHNHDIWSEIERFTRHLINTERLRP